MANEKKGVKEFLEALAKDEKLQEETKKAEGDTAKLVEIGKKHGYEFTEDDYNDLLMEAVNGGVLTEAAIIGIIAAAGAALSTLAPYIIAAIQAGKGDPVTVLPNNAQLNVNAQAAQ